MRARVAVLPVVSRVILSLVLAVERGEVSAVMYPVLVAIIRTHPPNISKFQYVLALAVTYAYGLKFGSTTQDPLQVRTTGGPSGLRRNLNRSPAFSGKLMLTARNLGRTG